MRFGINPNKLEVFSFYRGQNDPDVETLILHVLKVLLSDGAKYVGVIHESKLLSSITSRKGLNRLRVVCAPVRSPAKRAGN